MATIPQTQWTLGQLVGWLGGSKEDARLRLSDLGIDVKDKREVQVRNGTPGYFTKSGTWVVLRSGDIVRLRNMDIEIK